MRLLTAENMRTIMTRKGLLALAALATLLGAGLGDRAGAQRGA
jgi:hypothetical protein